MNWLVLFLAIIGFTTAKVILDERFSDGEGWTDRWVPSNKKVVKTGKFVLSHGRFYGDAVKDVGIQTATNDSYYHLSSRLKPFSNKEKILVLQFTVKHEQGIDCGGGYIKLFDCNLKPDELNSDSPYLVMFGPDKCGNGNEKVHVIFNHKGRNHRINKIILPMDDIFTHLYTLIVHPNQTYEVLIDNEVVESGELQADWDFLPQKRRLVDSEAKKPQDWDDRPTIEDPTDVKPDDWDVPEYLPNTEAGKPEDWNDEMYGVWEPPIFKNPFYRGEWTPKQIDNPAYKGKWVPPVIDNPEYLPDPSIGKYEEICFIGFDLWQVKAGTLFDNIFITDDPIEAKRIGNELWGATSKAEKSMKEAQEQEEAMAEIKFGDDEGKETGSRGDEGHDQIGTENPDMETGANDELDKMMESSEPATEELGPVVDETMVVTDSSVPETNEPIAENASDVPASNGVKDEPSEPTLEKLSCSEEPERVVPDSAIDECERAESARAFTSSASTGVPESSEFTSEELSRDVDETVVVTDSTVLKPKELIAEDVSDVAIDVPVYKEVEDEPSEQTSEKLCSSKETESAVSESAMNQSEKSKPVRKIVCIPKPGVSKPIEPRTEEFGRDVDETIVFPDSMVPEPNKPIFEEKYDEGRNLATDAVDEDFSKAIAEEVTSPDEIENVADDGAFGESELAQYELDADNLLNEFETVTSCEVKTVCSIDQPAIPEEIVNLSDIAMDEPKQSEHELNDRRPFDECERFCSVEELPNIHDLSEAEADPETEFEDVACTVWETEEVETSLEELTPTNDQRETTLFDDETDPREPAAEEFGQSNDAEHSIVSDSAVCEPEECFVEENARHFDEAVILASNTVESELSTGEFEISECTVSISDGAIGEDGGSLLEGTLDLASSEAENEHSTKKSCIVDGIENVKLELSSELELDASLSIDETRNLISSEVEPVACTEELVSLQDTENVSDSGREEDFEPRVADILDIETGASDKADVGPFAVVPEPSEPTTEEYVECLSDIGNVLDSSIPKPNKPLDQDISGAINKTENLTSDVEALYSQPAAEEPSSLDEI